VARDREKPTLRRGIAICALAVTLFFTHVSTYVLFVTTTALWALARRRGVAMLGAWLAPSVALALLWWRKGSLGGEIAAMSPLRSLEAIPVWTFDVWRSHVDEACAVAYWLAFGIVLFAGLRARAAP